MAGSAARRRRWRGTLLVPLTLLAAVAGVERGVAGATANVADFDGNGTSDVAVYRPNSGLWFVRDGTTTAWGTLGDIPAPGDYDGNGSTDVAVFRPSTGVWFVRDGVTTPFGTSGDIPVPADYDGNGTTDVAVFRPSAGAWFVRDGPSVAWGVPGDIPVPGDYDGSGTDDIAVFRPSAGVWFVRDGATTQFGASGDVAVPGRYDTDGDTDIAVFRPASGTWFVRGGTTAHFGVAGDVPTPGDYDGNGTTDMAVFRPATGIRHFVGGAPSVAWGTSGDIPLPLANPAATSEVVLAAGDIASCASSGDEATAALLDGHPVGTVATLGDNVYDNGTSVEFANCYDPSWGRHRVRTKPSAGNHEYNTAGAAGYYGYFGAAAGDPAKGYHSYELGTWHVVVVNSNCGAVSCAAGSAQESWLRADLAAHPAMCTLAYWHHPRFSSAAGHGSQTAMGPIWTALHDLGADVVLAGHDHVYERFAPLNAAGALDAAGGIRSFVVGTGGRSHYPFGTPLIGSEARNADTYGVLELTLRATEYDWRFIPEAGRTFTDTGTASCHA